MEKTNKSKTHIPDVNGILDHISTDRRRHGESLLESFRCLLPF